MKKTPQKRLYAATFEMILSETQQGEDYMQTLLFYTEHEAKVYDYIKSLFLAGKLELPEIRAESKYLRYKEETLQNPSYDPYGADRLYYYDEPIQLTIAPYTFDAITL